jgi:protein gp37
MSEKSAIEWTDATWNPVTGCTKVSPACANCYIERQTPFRVRHRKFVKGHIPLEFHENRLDAPLHWRDPRRVFVNSMSDLFHEDVPDVFIDRVFAVMALARWHTYQVLTKRAERLSTAPTRDRVGAALRARGVDENFVRNLRWPLPNVWLGVSVENQHFADERIPLLLQTPAAVRFISAEPLLGPVDLGFAFVSDNPWMVQQHVDWVIVGGESGPRVRPTDPDWIRSMRDQCVAAGVPFFFKQWGGRTAKSGGRLLDGRTWDEMPTVAR